MDDWLFLESIKYVVSEGVLLAVYQIDRSRVSKMGRAHSHRGCVREGLPDNSFSNYILE